MEVNDPKATRCLVCGLSAIAWGKDRHGVRRFKCTKKGDHENKAPKSFLDPAALAKRPPVRHWERLITTLILMRLGFSGAQIERVTGLKWEMVRPLLKQVDQTPLPAADLESLQMDGPGSFPVKMPRLLTRLVDAALSRIPKNSGLLLVDLQAVILSWIAGEINVREHLPNSALELRKRLANGRDEVAKIRLLEKIANRATRIKLVVQTDGHLRRVK